MKLGFCEICYIAPKSVEAFTTVGSVGSVVGIGSLMSSQFTIVPLGSMVQWIYNTSLSIGLCIIFFKLMIMLIKKLQKTDTPKVYEDLKNSIFGLLIMYAIPHFLHAVEFLCDSIIAMI